MTHLSWPKLQPLQHRKVRYGSLCSGIEAATVAWHLLPGWEPAWFSQYDPEHNYKSGPDFPSAVLAHHYPQVPNLGDMTTDDWMGKAAALGDIDVLVGGTPCQSFSIAGLRAGLSSSKGQLALRFCEIANAADPPVILWENVPGVLSSKDNAFGCFLAGLAGEDVPLVPPGGKWTDAGCVFGPQRTVCWRILDAQYAGVAQRRRRVFVVASPTGSGLDPCAILLEFDGVRRDSTPSREAGEGAAAGAGSGAAASYGFEPRIARNGRGDCGDLMSALKADAGKTGKGDAAPCVAVCGHSDRVTPPLDASYGRLQGCSDQDFKNGFGHLVCIRNSGRDCDKRTGRGQPIVAYITPEGTRNSQRAHEFPLKPGAGPSNTVDTTGGGGVVAFDTTQVTSKANYSNPKAGDPCHPLTADTHPPAVAFVQNTRSEVRLMGGDGNQVGALAAETGAQQQCYIAAPAMVRRLTPTECCILQGFPLDYTLIPWKNRPAADCPYGPRYKALGNSMAVPVMRWIGLRIHLALTDPQKLNPP